MKKVPKLSDQTLSDLARIPSFWQSFRFTHGSYNKAAKKMKLDPAILRRLGKARAPFEKKPKVSNETLTKLAKGLRRIDKRDYDVARRFTYVPANVEFEKGAAKFLTPPQIAYAHKYTARGAKEQAYFRKAVNDYYTGKTKRVLMPALDEGTGKTYAAGKSPTVRQLARESRKRERGKATRAVRRAGRRGNK